MNPFKIKPGDAFEKLPDEIVIKIFSYAWTPPEKGEGEKANQVAPFRLVSQRFHRLAWDPSLNVQLDVRKLRRFRARNVSLAIERRPRLKQLLIRANYFKPSELIKFIQQARPSIRVLQITDEEPSDPTFGCTDQVIREIAKCSNLKELYLGNMWNQWKVSDFVPLKELTGLTTLAFGQMILPDHQVSELYGKKNFKNLKTVIVDSCLGVSTVGLRLIKKNCPNASFISFTNTPLSVGY